jgi:hypothetical protein
MAIKQKLYIDSPFDLMQSERLSEELDSYLYSRFVETPEGFLKGRAVVTNTGIFPYYVDGVIENRLRIPEEVFDSESLESLKGVPLTDDHPSVVVTSENIKDYQIGHLGTDVRISGYYVSCDIYITDADTIEKVKNGKVALSCGYFSDIKEVSGDKWGQPYDSMQTNIRYNHVSIVDAGRAGEDARMYLDSDEFNSDEFAFGLKVSKHDEKPQANTEDNNDGKETAMIITVDNKQIDLSKDSAADLVLALVKDRDQFATDKDDLKAQLDAVVVEKDTLQANYDADKSLLTKAQDDYKELEESIDSRIADQVKALSEVTSVADSAEVEYSSEDSILDIKKKVILSQLDEKYHADVTAKMEDSEVYINASFDRAVMDLDSEEDNEQLNADNVLPKLDKDGKEVKEPTLDDAKAISDARFNKTED